MLKIDTRLEHEVMVLDIAGKLHAGDPGERLVDKVHSLLHQGHRRILLNLELVTSVDSGGFGALIAAQRAVTDSGGQVALLNATTRLESMLIIAGLVTHFRLFDLEQKALVALAPEWLPDVGDGLESQPHTRMVAAP